MFLSTEAPVSGRRVCQAEPAGEDLARPRGSALVASPVTTETWGAVRAGGCRGRGGKPGGRGSPRCRLRAGSSLARRTQENKRLFRAFR